MEQPQPFGLVVVTTGATPVRATVNQSDPTARVGVQGFMVQAHPANTGLIYIRIGSQGDDRVALARTIGIIGAPTSPTVTPPSMSFSKPLSSAGFNMADIYLQAGVDGDGAIISAVTG